MRKDALAVENYYHIFGRSIAGYRIFEESDCCERFVQMLNMYRFANFSYKYSDFARLSQVNKQALVNQLSDSDQKLVQIVAFCLMPTHFHLILRSLVDGGITKFMRKLLDSYTRYFNLLHHRKGPLWESHFKNILIGNDEFLLHLTRYIHLNPISLGLVGKPEDWPYSSYLEYISDKEGFCEFSDLFNFTPHEYQKFVEDCKEYQKQISIIKNILIEDYTG